MSLQLPVAVSKKSARRNGTRMIHASNHFSTSGARVRGRRERESPLAVSVSDLSQAYVES